MLYGFQIWGLKPGSKVLAKNFLAPLFKLQNQCLRRTTKTYKKTLCVTFERKAAIPPLNIYIDTTVMQKTVTVQNHPMKKKYAK